MKITTGMAGALETVRLDLSRSTGEIHAELRKRWPRALDLWWELDEGDRAGFVFNATKVLARLEHLEPTTYRRPA